MALISVFWSMPLLPVGREVFSRKESVNIMEINLATPPSTGDYSSCVSNESERTVERVAEAQLPTELGEFRLIGYRSLTSEEEFVVIAKGQLRPERLL